jgi:hypothetical protein
MASREMSSAFVRNFSRRKFLRQRGLFRVTQESTRFDNTQFVFTFVRSILIGKNDPVVIYVSSDSAVTCENLAIWRNGFVIAWIPFYPEKNRQLDKLLFYCQSNILFILWQIFIKKLNKSAVIDWPEKNRNRITGEIEKLCKLSLNKNQQLVFLTIELGTEITKGGRRENCCIIERIVREKECWIIYRICFIIILQ